VKLHSAIGRRVGYGLVSFGLVLFLHIAGVVPFSGNMPTAGVSVASAVPNATVQSLLNEGRTDFVRGQLPAAAEHLETALSTAQSQNDALGEVMVLSNLALVYGQQGQWARANAAIAESLELLASRATADANWQQVRAQTLNVQGRLQLAQGNAEAAYKMWGETAAVYEVAGDRGGYLRSRLRQARALQAMGFYRRAVDEILTPLSTELLAEPPSPLKSASLRTLAEALAVAESLDDARQMAEESLAVAEALDLSEEVAAAQLTLGNLEHAQAQEYANQNNRQGEATAVDQALNWYRLAASGADNPTNQLRSRLNQLTLLLDFDRPQDAAQLWSPLYAEVNAVAPDQAGIYTRVNFAYNLERIARQQVPGAPDWETIIALLETAQRDAIALQDARAEAHVLGRLGTVYKSKGEIDGDPTELKTAQKFTEDALFASEAVNAVDISYLWYEQLGDLHVRLQAMGDGGDLQKDAIAAYRGAVQSLKSLRTDLVTINPEVQFSFQKSIEPLHRKLVGLLLEGDAPPSQANLRDARSVIESLQLEELNNYLRAACLNSQEVSVDQISGSQRVAVVYPIVLPDRLGIITTLPTSQTKADAAPTDELKYYSSVIESDELERFTTRMLRQLVFVDYDVLNTAERLYHLLFPDGFLEDLASSQPDTLVIIPDGVLRSIPFAALFDGDRYLIEKYSIAITPGLQLLNPKPLQEKQLTALAFGLTEAVAEWSPLPNVAREIEAIQEQIDVNSFLNNEFTDDTFQEVLRTSSVPIVHLATHGTFSSQLEDTFIQAWDDRISVNDLSAWLRSDRTEPVELLVLSACETASGDQRAALGLAGMAIRAGARSTVASLWQVDDAATAIFMTRFYEAISSRVGNKAEALRTAQTYLIENYRGDFDHPYYWAPFVLIGNWL